jgi:hypothetical protein
MGAAVAQLACRRGPSEIALLRVEPRPLGRTLLALA